MQYVIARYEEDISWSDGLDRFVVQKGQHLPNAGREASSYLWYIAEFYDELQGVYAFRQGTPDGVHHGLEWGVSLDHELSLYNYDIRAFAQRLGVNIPENLRYWLGAQYDVTAETIKRRTRDWYQDALHVANTWPKAPWLFERAWPYIWFEEATPWKPAT